MQQRIRWYEADWPIEVPALTQKLKKMLFTPKADDGFILHSTRKHEVSGVYIERLQIKETVVDPFGNRKEYSRIEFLTTNFRLSSNFPNIEIRNPPRSLQSFQARLSEICDFSIYITPLEVSPIKWAEKFSSLSQLKLAIKAIQLDNISLDSEIKAEMLIKSDVNLIRIFDQLLPWKVFDIKKASCVTGTVPERCSLVFNKSGSLSYSHELEEWVQEFGTQSLQELK